MDVVVPGFIASVIAKLPDEATLDDHMQLAHAARVTRCSPDPQPPLPPEVSRALAELVPAARELATALLREGP